MTQPRLQLEELLIKPYYKNQLSIFGSWFFVAENERWPYIRIIYSDKSKCTLTGKHRDIPLELAKHYYNQYAAGKQVTATYQQYPKKDYVEMDLFQKIEELENED